MKPDSDTIYELICEGRCNPTLRAIDERIASERRQLATVSFATLQALKLLHYTPHCVDGRRAYCHDCGTTRRYGGNT